MRLLLCRPAVGSKAGHQQHKLCVHAVSPALLTFLFLPCSSLQARSMLQLVLPLLMSKVCTVSAAASAVGCAAMLLHSLKVLGPTVSETDQVTNLTAPTTAASAEAAADAGAAAGGGGGGAESAASLGATGPKGRPRCSSSSSSSLALRSLACISQRLSCRFTSAHTAAGQSAPTGSAAAAAPADCPSTACGLERDGITAGQSAPHSPQQQLQPRCMRPARSVPATATGSAAGLLCSCSINKRRSRHASPSLDLEDTDRPSGSKRFCSSRTGERISTSEDRASMQPLVAVADVPSALTSTTLPEHHQAETSWTAASDPHSSTSDNTHMLLLLLLGCLHGLPLVSMMQWTYVFGHNVCDIKLAVVTL